MIIDEDAYMEHHGIKGMHWGFRKQREKTGRRDGSAQKIESKGNDVKAQKECQSIVARSLKSVVSPHEQAKALAANKQKFVAKFEPPVGSKKGIHFRLTSKEKKLAVGAAFVGLLVVADKTKTGKSLIKAAESKALHIPEAGTKVDPESFKHAINMSMLTTWSSPNSMGYLKPPAFEQGEMSFPIGHVFHRLSTAPEIQFLGPTYSVPDMKCFHRYMVGFSGEKGLPLTSLRHVTFQAKKNVKIPSLTHQIDTMREVINERHGGGYQASREEAMKTYAKFCGGSWQSEDAQSLFKKLSTQGYHAIVDHMDAGVIGDNPLVVFNYDSFTNPTSATITKDLVQEAKTNLVELSHRKL